MPDRLKQIVELCWNADLQKRPEFEQLSKEMDDIWYTLPREQNSVATADSGPTTAKGCCCLS